MLYLPEYNQELLTHITIVTNDLGFTPGNTLRIVGLNRVNECKVVLVGVFNSAGYQNAKDGGVYWMTLRALSELAGFKITVAMLPLNPDVYPIL